MSGTSLDGIDIVIVDFDDSTPINLIAAQTYPFGAQLRDHLEQLILTQHCDLREFGEVDIALGEAISEAINNILSTHSITSHDITAIGSHGQTVFHQPGGSFPFSLQIGNANVIAEKTGITTIADFRQRDMVLGGQGAPLVPAFHKALFQDCSENRVIVNIGGISNITVLPSKQSEIIVGFDTGPGNVLLDTWIKRHNNCAYDKAGQWAASGTVNDTLLAILLADNYFEQVIPKSSGREYFNLNWLDNKLSSLDATIEPHDVQATLLALTATAIANDIKRYATNTDTVYVCGGGAHNEQLMLTLQQALQTISVTTTVCLGLHPDWVEACAFAWLAKQTLAGQSGNLPATTGASRASILGGIYPSNDAS